LDVLLVTNLAFLASIPERYAEEEVSIIINDLRLSGKASLAIAANSGRERALGVVRVR
jgi:hypothetical protein